MKKKTKWNQIGYLVCGLGMFTLSSIGMYYHFSLYSAYNNGDIEKISAYGDYMRDIHPQYEVVMFASLLDKAFEFKDQEIISNFKMISLTADNHGLKNTKLYQAVEVYLNESKSKKNYIISLQKAIDTINTYTFFKSKKKMVGLYRASMVTYIGEKMKEGKYEKELVDNYFEVYEDQKSKGDYDKYYFYEELFDLKYMLDDLVNNNELEGNVDKTYVAAILSKVFSEICIEYSGEMSPYSKKKSAKLEESLKKMAR